MLVVALAAALRFVPIWFGLPYEYARPDEEVTIGHAVNALGGELNPRFFHWPSLTFYLLAACFWGAGAVRRLAGLAPATYVTDLLVARAVMASVGTLTVALTYRLARRIDGDDVAGVIAAGLLAVAPLHVRDSHFAMTDVLATFFVVSAVLLLLRAMDDRAIGWFAASGFVAGLGASTKYSAAAVTVSMAAAQIAILAAAPANWRDPRRWRPSIVFAAASVGGFVLGTPYALLDSRAFLDGVAYDVTHLTGGHNGVQVGVGWSYHIARSLPAALGWPIFIAGLVGFVPMMRRQRAAAGIIGAFCLAVYASLGPGHTVFFRYVVPLTPFLCVSAAFAARAVTPAPGAVALLLAAPALVTSTWSDVLLARTDTRVLASQWLVDHVKPGESLYVAGAHFSDPPLGALQPQAWPREIFDAASGRFAGAGLPDWLIVPESPITLYTTVPASLRGVAMQRYDLVHRVRATHAGDVDAGVYDLDDAFFLPASGFEAILRPGPTLIIYHRAGGR